MFDAGRLHRVSEPLPGQQADPVTALMQVGGNRSASGPYGFERVCSKAGSCPWLALSGSAGWTGVVR